MKEVVATLSTWRYSGFDIFYGKRISPKNDTAMENLARYIIRASFSQERMQGDVLRKPAEIATFPPTKGG